MKKLTIYIESCVKKILQFLQESNGQLSSIRLASLMVVATFIGDWWGQILRNQSFDPSFNVVLLVAGILGLKIWQKKFEQGA